MNQKLKLAERIQAVLDQGTRYFVLEGAELDWVIEALKEKNKGR